MFHPVPHVSMKISNLFIITQDMFQKASMMRGILLMCSLIVMSACYLPYVMAPDISRFIVRVESDGEWEGVIGHHQVSGFGTMSYPVDIIWGTVCWDIRKRYFLQPGLLRAFLTYHDYYAGSQQHPRYGDQVTTLGHRVSGCYTVR